MISPVILPIADTGVRGREKIKLMRDASREALRICAYLGGVKLGTLKKDQNGAPRPFSGIHWSVSHTSLFAAASLAKCPTGVDIEKIKPRSEGVMNKVISSKEMAHNSEDVTHFFFRVWTAKEAVLKAEGIGLAGLAKCLVTCVPDKFTMLMDYEGRAYKVSQVFLDGHAASVVTGGEEPVEWVVL